MTRSVLATALLLAGAARATGLPWEIWETPARLAELDAGDLVLERSSHCLDGCRYDRSGGAPNAADAYPQRWLYRDGDEAVVFDERGPGAITRIWMTTGSGTSSCIDPTLRVRFHLDGAAAAALDVPLAALFDGSTWPFAPPLAEDRTRSSGGYVSHVPIAWAQSLRIGLVGTDTAGGRPCPGDATATSSNFLWFQFQHHRLAPGTPVAGFVAGQDAPAWRSFLARAGDDPWAGMLAPESRSATLAPGATLALAARSGIGWLRGIRLQLPRSAYADVSLRVAIDGEVAVDLPLADFFATPVQATHAARGVLAGEGTDGWLYAWLPMPYRQGVELELRAAASLPATVAVAASLSFDPAAVPDRAGTFRASLVDECRDRGDFALYDHRGAGKLVGVAATYRANGAAPNRAVLEGDERAHLDDAAAPSWYGTGVEDFYDGGFYFDRGAFADALSGATVVDTAAPYSTAAYRWMPTDPIAWTSRLRLTQEVGAAPAEPYPGCVRAVVYAYRRERPLLVGYGGFDVGGTDAATHAYAPPAGAQCATSSGQFEDDAATARTATSCRYGAGTSRFAFHLDADAAPPLRLRRTFDAGCKASDADCAAPGTTAGSAAAEVRINGRVAGHFAPAIANPARRWQMQEILLDVDPWSADLDVEILPQFTPATPLFDESGWELRGGWKDSIFAGGFE